jgi:hypothetical protein
MDIMTAKDLRILSLKNVIEKIYDMIVATALRGHTFVDFTMCLLLEYYNLNVELDTPKNVAYIFEELGKLFPGVLFFDREIQNKNGKTLWRACWKEKETMDKTN